MEVEKEISSNRRRNFLKKSGISGGMLSMAVMVVFIGFGEKMGERFLPLYIISLGGSAVAVALLNTMDNLLSSLYSYPGGWISDKLGHKKALIIFTLFALVGYMIVIFIPVWQSVLIGAVFFIAWTAVSLPAIMSLVSKTMPGNKRVTGVTIHSFVRRIPMALGPVAGGVLIASYGEVTGMRIAFSVASVLALLSIGFVIKFMPEDKPRAAGKEGFLRTAGNLRGRLGVLLVSDILVRFAEQIPYAFVVIWVVTMNGLTTVEFGILTMIEMVTALIVYIPVAYFADKHGKKPFVLMTFVFFTLFPLVLIFSRSFNMLVIAFIIRGLKEFGEPTRKALIMDLAPEESKAGTFGAYYLVRDIFVSAAAFGAAFLWNISPEVNFIAAFIFGLAGCIVFAIKGSDRDAGATIIS
ncbi:MAG TPA: MFS transporter [Clostridia bacterium]|nr:MFS transporter [Clostridia bacterium]HPQ45896.1 MFS transporter [Clostridia bacterium]HRX41825.1 MFS transporter [Clostridia bacterium]